MTQRTRAPRTILSRVINLSLLVIMLVLSVTSVQISREVFSALPLTSTFTARQIHSLVGYLALIIAAVHLGLHWTIIMGVVRRALGVTAQSKTAGICLQWLAAAMAAAGVYSLFALNVGSKLLMQPTLEYWDFETATPAFFGHLLGIVFCSAFVSHHLSKFAGAFVAVGHSPVTTARHQPLAEALRLVSPAPNTTQERPMTPRYAQRMAKVQPSAIGELLALGADPSIISFGGGYPDATLFPAEQLDAVFHDIITAPGGAAMQYAPSNGLPRLREQIAWLMREDGMHCSADDVLVLQGSQQGLDFAARMLVDPGDVIVTEDPTFLGALIAFAPNQPDYAVVPVDAEGMQTDRLEAILAAQPRAKMIYTVPDFQNPTGVTLSLDRRKELLALASRYDLIVVEDTPYRHIRFAGQNLPTLRSLDTEGRVIHLGSFSKVLVPGLRIGWALANPDLLSRMGQLKVAADTQTSTLNMSAASLFLDRYDLNAHIATLRAAYATKKEAMLDAIRQHFPQQITATDPMGGLFTWLTFPDGFDATDFMRDVALPQARVAYVPGATFFPLTPRANHARLNFSSPSLAAIQTGIAALGRALHANL